MKVDTVIIGGGLSGLTCAVRLEEQKRDYMLIEKSNRLGGRVGSIYENGNIYDIGFQVFNTAYQNTIRLFDDNEIRLRMFKPGAVIHDGSSFKLISDPLRDPKQLFVSLFSSLSSFKDKLRVLSLIFDLSNYDIQKDKSEDMTTIDFLKKRKFSDKFIELFFNPFFAGIFLEKDLKTSSKFFKYVFSNFSKGLACIPQNGMQTIPDLIAKNINSDRILLNQSLEKIEDGKALIFNNGLCLQASNIVLTGGSHEKIGLNPVKYNSVENLYFVSDIDIKNGKYIHLFPKDSIINNIAVLNKISKHYCKSNNLLSISIIGRNSKDKLDIALIKKRLSNYFGGNESNYDYVRNFSIKNATIMQGNNFYQSNSQPAPKGFIIAGDHSFYGSIEGAVLSGIKASEEVLS
ncbi:MAG: FAD-dependent oxidoreductase [Candidatus Neomarinimicrobiota bacterium]